MTVEYVVEGVRSVCPVNGRIDVSTVTVTLEDAGFVAAEVMEALLDRFGERRLSSEELAEAMASDLVTIAGGIVTVEVRQRPTGRTSLRVVAVAGP